MLTEPGEKPGPHGFKLALICRISGETGDAIGVGLKVVEFVGGALAKTKLPLAAGIKVVQEQDLIETPARTVLFLHGSRPRASSN